MHTLLFFLLQMDTQPFYLFWILCHFNLVLELSLLVSVGRSHGIRLVSIVKVLSSIFVCMNGLALQEVAVKKFLDQDFSGDALAQFKSEVSNYLYMHMCIHMHIYDSCSYIAFCRLRSC